MADRAQRRPAAAGAQSMTGQTRLGPRWLPWLALLLLAIVVALVAWMVMRDDDDDAFPQTPQSAAEWTSAHHDPVHV